MKVDGFARTTAWILWMAVTLTACGGGGGGGGNSGRPIGPAALTVSMTPNALNVTADAGTSSQPTADINLTLNREPDDDEGLLVFFRPSNAGIVDWSLTASSPTAATVRIHFADPIVIGPGTHTGTVELKICEAQGDTDICARELAGSPRTIPVTYTVTGVQPPAPSMSATDLSIEASGLSVANIGPTATTGVRIENLGSSPIYVGTTSTSNGLSYVSYWSQSASEGTLQLYFKSPSMLTPGVHEDTVTLTATCNGCPRPVENSPLVINVRYTVGKSMTSLDGSYTLRVVDGVVANDIVWSEANGRLYASTPSTAADTPNSIVAIDPETGEVDGSAFAGSEPGRLAVSDDGTLLYAALRGSNSVQRLALPALTQSLLIPLGSHTTFGAYYASDLEVMPGQANTIAVARYFTTINPAAAGIIIYDDATARADTVGTPPNIDRLEFGDTGTTLYGATSQDSSFAISTMQVDNDGVALLSQHTGISSQYYFDLHHADGLLYVDTGQAFDPVQNLVIGTYTNPDAYHSRSAVPDPASGKFFRLDYGGHLAAFDLDTFTILNKTILQGLNISTQPKTRLVRWGTDGLAFTTDDGKVLLLNGTFVN